MPQTIVFPCKLHKQTLPRETKGCYPSVKPSSSHANYTSKHYPEKQRAVIHPSNHRLPVQATQANTTQRNKGLLSIPQTIVFPCKLHKQTPKETCLRKELEISFRKLTVFLCHTRYCSWSNQKSVLSTEHAFAISSWSDNFEDCLSHQVISRGISDHQPRRHFCIWLD